MKLNKQVMSAPALLKSLYQYILATIGVAFTVLVSLLKHPSSEGLIDKLRTNRRS